MSQPQARVVIAGSARHALPVTRSPRTEERGTVDVYLRRATPLAEITSYGRSRPFATRGELAARPEDVELVRAFAARHELEVTSADLATRCVSLDGTWHALGEAFGTTIAVVELDGAEVFRNVGELSLPAALASAVEAVLGLDTTPVVRRHGTFSSGGNSLHVADVLARYQVPTRTPAGDACDGRGETIALLQYEASFEVATFDAFFTAQGLPAPVCKVRHLPNRARGPAPHTNDGEASGDALMIGQAAPGATIVQWLSRTFSAKAVTAAIRAATTDATEPATVLSMSYGWVGWTAAELAMIDSAYQDAAALGVTCLNSSGDSGSHIGVQSPADCQHVLAVGGTVIEADGTEVVWNDELVINGVTTQLASTGGYSTTFVAPFWQTAVLPAGQTMRGVPDVSAHADSYDGMVGTSVSAPLWAAWVARINQLRIARGLGRLGLVAPDLYAARRTLTDITTGDNALGSDTLYAATTGWDPTTGLGVPTGATASALSGHGIREPGHVHRSDGDFGPVRIVPRGDPPE